MTAEIQARVAEVIQQQLTPALAHMPQVCPKGKQPGEEVL